jgi:hypothetical protein
MADLSPATKAILEMVNAAPHCGSGRIKAAAALRAAADQVVPEEPLHGGDQRWMYERDARQDTRRKFLAVAAELEAQ